MAINPATKKPFTPEEIAKEHAEQERVQKAEEKKAHETNVMMNDQQTEKNDILPKGCKYIPASAFYFGADKVPVPGKLIVKFYIWNTIHQKDYSTEITVSVVKVRQVAQGGAFAVSGGIVGEGSGDDKLTLEALKNALVKARNLARAAIEGQPGFDNQKIRMEGEPK